MNENSTKTFINNSNIIIAERFLKLQTLYTNGIHDIIKVYDNLLDKESVLKILKDKNNKALLKNEFKIIMALSNFNIIRGYELYDKNSLFFYSMEYIEDKFDLKQMKLYISDLLKAFKHIHSLNFIHNDIKFNNFLFTEKRAVIIDFSKSERVRDISKIIDERLILSRFLIQWINNNLKIDFLGNPKGAKKYLFGKDVDMLLNMFYRKGV